jgi:hypothetical protein
MISELSRKGVDMKKHELSAVFILALTVTSVVLPVGAEGAAPDDGLVAVVTRNLEEFYVRPKADLASYRRILVDPPRAELQRGWLKSMNATRDVTRWLVADDAKRITDVAEGAMRGAITRAFAERGYETVTEPGPGVLRLSPSVTDLYVNSPDVPAPGIQIGIVHKEAGSATLRLDARDSVTGTLVGQVIDRDTAQEVGRFDRATTVSNLFWFEAMMSQWAANCAKEFEAARALP